MLERVGKLNPDTVEYWASIAMAVLWILVSGQASEDGRIYFLFGAGFTILHAHGRRILAAIKQTSNGKADKEGQ